MHKKWYYPTMNIIIPLKKPNELNKWSIIVSKINTYEKINFFYFVHWEGFIELGNIYKKEILYKASTSLFDFKQKRFNDKLVSKFINSEYRYLLGFKSYSEMNRYVNIIVNALDLLNKKYNFNISIASGSSDLNKVISTEYFSCSYRITYSRLFNNSKFGFFVSTDNSNQSLIKIESLSEVNKLKFTQEDFLNDIRGKIYRESRKNIKKRIKYRCSINLLNAFLDFFRIIFNFGRNIKSNFSYFKFIGFIRWKFFELLNLIQNIKIFDHNLKNNILIALPVRNDAQAVLRSDWKGIISTLKTLQNNKKINFKNIILKLHPGDPGSLSILEFIKIKIKYGNKIRLAPLNKSSLEIIKHSKLVICANSSMIFESLALDKPILTYSNSFFKFLPNVYKDFESINLKKRYYSNTNRVLDEIISCYISSAKSDCPEERHYLYSIIMEKIISNKFSIKNF